MTKFKDIAKELNLNEDQCRRAYATGMKKIKAKLSEKQFEDLKDALKDMVGK